MDRRACSVCARQGTLDVDPDGSLWSREVIHDLGGDVVEWFCADPIPCMSTALRRTSTQV